MDQLSQLLQKNNLFYSLIFLNLILRLFLSQINLGGGDVFNALSFYLLTLNQYDYYSFFDINSSPPPYLPFSKFIYLMYGNIAELLNITFNNLTKFLSAFFDLLIGLLILKYLKNNSSRHAYLISLIYIFNPLTIYLTTQLGFNDSLTILILIYCCYMYDGKYCDYNLLAFFLALSLCIKPFTLIFIPFFFLNAKNKTKFTLIFLLTIFILNSFYLISTDLNRLIEITSFIFIKLKTGHQLSSHGLGLIAKNLDIYSLNFSYLKILKVILIIFLIYLNLFFLKNVKSIKFIYFTFFLIFLFVSNIHWQYFLWIVPFMILFKLNYKYFIFNIGFLCMSLLFSFKTAESSNNSGLYTLKIFNANYDQNSFFNGDIFDRNNFLLIALFYFFLIINYKINFKTHKRFIKKIFSKKNSIKNFFNGNNYKKKNYFITYLFSTIFILIFLIFSKSLYKSTLSVKNILNENSVNNLVIPQNSLNFSKYFNENKIILDLFLYENNKNYLNLSLVNNHFYEIKINKKMKDFYFDEDFFTKKLSNKLFFIKKKLINPISIDGNKIEIEINFKKLNKNNQNFFSVEFKDGIKNIDLKKTKALCYRNKNKIPCRINVDNNLLIIDTLNYESQYLNGQIIIIIIFSVIVFLQFFLLKKFIYYKSYNYNSI